MTDEDIYDIAPGLYEHYKGTRYRVIGNATHTETEERLTLYYAEDVGMAKIWARPASMFAGTVKIDGQTQPRFRLLELKPFKGE